MKRIATGFTLVELMIVVAVVGILATNAIPSYQDYVVRGRVSEALAAMGACKTSIADYVANKGGLPTNLTASGCSDSPMQYVSGVDVLNGVVTITLATRMDLASASGGTLTLTPGTPTASLAITMWTCAAATIPSKYLPGSCR